MEIGKRYRFITQGVAAQGNHIKRATEGVLLHEYPKFYIIQTRNYKETILKSMISTGECKVIEIAK